MNIERLHQLFDLDRESGTLRWKLRTNNRIKVGDVAGTPHRMGYLQVSVDGKQMLTHRIVFVLMHGYLPERIDHIDGNPMNNRPDNLRAASHAENMRNARRQHNNKSGVKGVYWNKKAGKWQAQCTANGRKFGIGYFADLEAAAAAVSAARVRLHGAFARHA